MLTLWDLIEPVVTPMVDRLRGKRPPAAPINLAPPPPPPAPIPQVTARKRPGPARRKHPARDGRFDSPPEAPAPAAAPMGDTAPASSGDTPAESAQDRYDRVTREMLTRYGVRVRRWRSSMSGMAWELRYTDGSRKRLIEAPRPKGPMSAAVFLHEIGHHAIGFDRYKPRCLEEYHAWAWAIASMQREGLNVTEAVLHRMHESLWYAVAKAKRRGIKGIPPELEPFQIRPPRRRRQPVQG